MAQANLTARRAVVIGAGIGGLTSAAALAAHFSRVVVLERDDLPFGPAPRAGVPQGKHPAIAGRLAKEMQSAAP